MKIVNILATVIIPAVLLILCLAISQNRHLIQLMQEHHFSNVAIAQNVLMMHYV